MLVESISIPGVIDPHSMLAQFVDRANDPGHSPFWKTVWDIKARANIQQVALSPDISVRIQLFRHIQGIDASEFFKQAPDQDSGYDGPEDEDED